MNNIQIFLVRHGETTWNSRKIWQGQIGDGLNDYGKKQAELAAYKLVDKSISKIYSSDLKRTLETARIISDRLGVDIHEDSEFRERSLGLLSGMQESEILKRYPTITLEDGFLGSNDIGNAEPWNDFCNRVTSRFLEASTESEGNVCIVTHGGVIYVIFRYIDKNFHRKVVPNGSISVVELSKDGSFSIKGIDI